MGWLRDPVLMGSKGLTRYPSGTRRQHPQYNRWYKIRNRCYNKKSPDYAGYGAKGVRMDPVWKDSFDAFLLFVSNLPFYGEPGRTLDRIDPLGNYEPGNVRWATPLQQRMNQGDSDIREPALPPFALGVTTADLDSYYGFKPTGVHRRTTRFGRAGSAVAGLRPVMEWRRQPRGGVLADHEILSDTWMTIHPLNKDLVGPCSVDLTLGPELKVYRDRTQPTSRQEPVSIDLRYSPYRMRQGEFLLAHTVETVKMHDGAVGFVCGKSSRAREGLQVETAGLVDPGFEGEIVLELFALMPQVLTYGQKIAQIYAIKLTGAPMHPYDFGGHHYQKQTGAQHSVTGEEA